MEHLMENDVEANNDFDNLLGRKAKRRRARRKSDRKRGRKMRLRAKYGGLPAIASGYGRPAPRPNAYADASIGTQVAQEMVGGDALISGGQWIGSGGSSATLNKRGKLGGVIGKLFNRRKRRNRKHKKLLRAINNPRWLTDPRNHWKLKDAVRGMAIQSNNDGKTAEEMVKFSQLKPKRRFPTGKSWMNKKPFFKGSRHYGFDGDDYFNAEGTPTQKGFFAKYWWIIALVGGGAFLFLTPQGKKLMGKITGK